MHGPSNTELGLFTGTTFRQPHFRICSRLLSRVAASLTMKVNAWVAEISGRGLLVVCLEGRWLQARRRRCQDSKTKVPLQRSSQWLTFGQRISSYRTPSAWSSWTQPVILNYSDAKLPEDRINPPPRGMGSMGLRLRTQTSPLVIASRAT